MTTNLIKLDKKVRPDLESIPHQEELLWFQKSRSDWIALGDRNTRYFQCVATIRGQRNKITSLRNASSDWVYEESELQVLALSYFKNLYQYEGPNALF